MLKYIDIEILEKKDVNDKANDNLIQKSMHFDSCKANVINSHKIETFLNVTHDPLNFYISRWNHETDIRGFIESLFRYENKFDYHNQSLSMCRQEANNNYSDCSITEYARNELYSQCNAQSFRSIPDSNMLIYWVGGKDYFHSLFGWKTPKRWQKRMHIQHIRGYLSNVYVRWLGYPHKTPKDKYDALFEYSDTIESSFQTFGNALLLLLRIDYVLPFERVPHSQINKENENEKDKKDTKDEIKFDIGGLRESSELNENNMNAWSVLLYFLNEYKKIKIEQNSNSLMKSVSKDWKHEMKSQQIPGSSSAKFQNSINKKERKILKRKNNFDLLLYQISKKIVKADQFFYKLNGVQSAFFGDQRFVSSRSN